MDISKTISDVLHEKIYSGKQNEFLEKIYRDTYYLSYNDNYLIIQIAVRDYMGANIR